MNDKKKNLVIFLMAILILILIAVIVGLAVLSKKAKTEPEPIVVPTQATSQTTTSTDNDLNYSFLKLENTEKNNIYSPLSIKYALKMVEEGAGGETKAQIEKLTKDLKLTKYDDIEKILSLANCVYIRDTYKKYVKDEFKSRIIGKYNAEINYDEFKDASNINKWIEEKTMGIIKNMLSDDQVQDTEMLLINALAIDMEIENPFSEEDTTGQDFTKANGKKIKASMMTKSTNSDSFAYYKDNNVTSVTIDLKKYDNTQLEFIAIMPENSLEEYIKSFTQKKLESIRNNSKLATEAEDGVIVKIPRFSFEGDLMLKSDLKNLGMLDAFNSDTADFTNMTSKTGLYIGDALHKAYIEFSEKGVKAAAVTTVTAVSLSAPEFKKYEPIIITIDKPFLFIIRDRATGEIWFVGTVYEPELWDNASVE